MRSTTRRSRLILVAALSLAALGSLVTGAGPRPVAAQQSPDCEQPDVVACIPTAGNPQPQPSGAVGAPALGAPAVAAPAAAAAAAPPAAVVPPCPPQPWQGPYPPGAPAVGDGSAVAQPYPYPYPYPCLNDIYATINRANLAYARAMRSLDSSQLRAYWGQDALQQLLDQIRSLRASDSYRVLQLASIQVIEQSIGSNYAWVHTNEHWIWATYSGGYQYEGADAWYDNQYYLYRQGGRWVIGTDIVR